MDNSHSPTREEIFLVARKLVNALNKLKLSCCLFGSTACVLNGVMRIPNDVDMIVMTESLDQEALKRLVVGCDRSFYLLPSGKVGETDTMLYSGLEGVMSNGYKRRCRVDIFVPQTLNLPIIPQCRIETIDNLPVLPLFPLLLLKLQAWSVHHNAKRKKYKQYVDIVDLAQLHEIARDKGVRLHYAQWLPDSFLDPAVKCIQRYVQCYGKPDDWRRIGFDI
ncbi:hypothetical protein K474DRAFT_1711585 [Panus rudis PR-1116 ss-1]|nr:hypothetical protein K474DRAFT_1711585 [Panus rudis PR-1116 ss-1]